MRLPCMKQCNDQIRVDYLLEHGKQILNFASLRPCAFALKKLPTVMIENEITPQEDL